MCIRAIWSESLLIAIQKRDEQEPFTYWMDVQADLSLCWLWLHGYITTVLQLEF